MAFGNTFDEYCVIHAPFAAPQRRAEFEASLASVGVARYRVVEAERVPADDPRAKPFGSPGPVSLIDAVVRVVELARAEGWGSVAIFEDDVIFRRRFAARWAQVEADVRTTPWDVLTLYRWPWHNVIIEKPFARTSLLPIRWTLTTHAYAIRASGYDVVLAAIAACLAEGKPLDLFTGKVTRAGGKVFATSHNLAGQTSMSGGSTLGNSSDIRRRGRKFLGEFGSYRSRLEYVAASGARAVLRAGRRLTGGRG